ncbi:hypothetical protein N9Y67_00145 [Pseudomonadota bacterium]|nr:hypothetical protein [Pseudomonadota bacterium]
MIIESMLLAKIVGSFMGSSVVVLRLAGTEPWLASFKRWTIGMVSGIGLTTLVMNYFSIKYNFDNALGTAMMIGLFGYILLDIALTKEVGEKAKSEIIKRIKGGE